MKTTPPTVSQARDIDGRRVPFGLPVLVLEAEEVVRAYMEAGKSASVAPTAAFKAMMDPLLGPLRKLNAQGKKPVVGKINRYPPCARSWPAATLSARTPSRARWSG